ncbi:hypothetical protein GCM10009789_33890 [Kribbella sancticallisti]|uniref:Uncharacterized protein n=1 Tax=Kribbella sancticallisti TaxID=460087 RepID=A0ABN2DHH5_9ACTN
MPTPPSRLAGRPARRFARRVAAAGLATLTIVGAAVAGASAALPSPNGQVSTCASNPIARALDVALSVRSVLDPDHTPTC